MTARILPDGEPCAIPACPCGQGPMPERRSEKRFTVDLTLLEFSAVEALRGRMGLEEAKARGDAPAMAQLQNHLEFVGDAHQRLWFSFVNLLRRRR